MVTMWLLCGGRGGALWVLCGRAGLCGAVLGRSLRMLGRAQDVRPKAYGVVMGLCGAVWGLCIVVYLMYLMYLGGWCLVLYCIVLSCIVFYGVVLPPFRGYRPVPRLYPRAGVIFLRRVRGCAKGCCCGMVGLPGICVTGRGCVGS